MGGHPNPPFVQEGLNTFAFIEFWEKAHPGAYNLKDLQVVCSQFPHEMSCLKYILQIFHRPM